MTAEVSSRSPEHLPSWLRRGAVALTLALSACNGPEDETDEMAEHDVEISIAHQVAPECDGIEGHIERQVREISGAEIEVPFLDSKTPLSPEGYHELWFDEGKFDNGARSKLIIHNEGDINADDIWLDRTLGELELRYSVVADSQDLADAGCEVRFAVSNKYVSEDEAFPFPENLEFEPQDEEGHASGLTSHGIFYQVVHK